MDDGTSIAAATGNGSDNDGDDITRESKRRRKSYRLTSDPELDPNVEKKAYTIIHNDGSNGRDPRQRKSSGQSKRAILSVPGFKPTWKPKSCTRVFVTGLSKDIDAEFLVLLCSAFGNVSDHILHQPSTESTNFATVVFQEQECALRYCQQYDTTKVLGEPLRIYLDPCGLLADRHRKSCSGDRGELDDRIQALLSRAPAESVGGEVQDDDSDDEAPENIVIPASLESGGPKYEARDLNKPKSEAAQLTDGPVIFTEAPRSPPGAAILEDAAEISSTIPATRQPIPKAKAVDKKPTLKFSLLSKPVQRKPQIKNPVQSMYQAPQHLVKPDEFETQDSEKDIVAEKKTSETDLDDLQRRLQEHLREQEAIEDKRREEQLLALQEQQKRIQSQPPPVPPPPAQQAATQGQKAGVLPPPAMPPPPHLRNSMNPPQAGPSQLHPQFPNNAAGRPPFPSKFSHPPQGITLGGPPRPPMPPVSQSINSPARHVPMLVHNLQPNVDSGKLYAFLTGLRCGNIHKANVYALSYGFAEVSPIAHKSLISMRDAQMGSGRVRFTDCGNRVRVVGLDDKVDSTTQRQVLSNVLQNVSDVQVINDENKGRCAHATFQSPQDAIKALLGKQGTKILGKPVRIEALIPIQGELEEATNVQTSVPTQAPGSTSVNMGTDRSLNGPDMNPSTGGQFVDRVSGQAPFAGGGSHVGGRGYPMGLPPPPVGGPGHHMMGRGPPMSRHGPSAPYIGGPMGGRGPPMGRGGRGGLGMALPPPPWGGRSGPGGLPLPPPPFALGRGRR